MFFVHNGKIYHDVLDPAKNWYTEVKIFRKSADSDEIMFRLMDSGLEKKPKNRKIMTGAEIKAKFGASAPVFGLKTTESMRSRKNDVE